MKDQRAIVILACVVLAGCSTGGGDDSAKAAKTPVKPSVATSEAKEPVRQPAYAMPAPRKEEPVKLAEVTENSPASRPAHPVLVQPEAAPLPKYAADSPVRAERKNRPIAVVAQRSDEPRALPPTELPPRPMLPTNNGLPTSSTATVSAPLPNPLRGGERPAGELRPEPQAETPPKTRPPRELPPAVITPLVKAPDDTKPHADVGPAADAGGHADAEMHVVEPLTIGKHSPVKFDPVRENGKIFEKWPDNAQLALIITGRQEGYLEPCGCAGLDRMKGGMSRRFTLFNEIRRHGWPSSDAAAHAGHGIPVVGLDVGGISKGYGPQALMKFQTTVDGMKSMGYTATMLGTTDLQLPAGELLAATSGNNSDPSLFIAGNVALFGFDAGLTPPSRIVNVGGRKLGITAVLGAQEQRAINNAEVAMSDPVAALSKVLPELKKKADFLILLAYASKNETLGPLFSKGILGGLVAKFPDFDIVVMAGDGTEPPSMLNRIKGTRTHVIEVGEKGMNAIVLGLYDDPTHPLRYQRVPLDSRFAAARQMTQLMAAYQDELKTKGLEGLGIKALPYPQTELGRYVGSESCKACHAKSYKIWKKSKHSEAFQALVTAVPPRNYDPECISCHVIGWDSTKFFPYQNGYQSAEKTPKLLNVGCENCHGPGEAHVKAEQGNNKALQAKLQAAMTITRKEAADPTSKKHNCVSCHDLDNSPDFKFPLYWPQVEHHEN